MDINQPTDQPANQPIDQPTNQPIEQSIASTTIQTSAAAASGVLGTKMPATVAFAVAILLFLLPFSEIKCGGSAIMNKSGVNYTMGSDWKASGGYGKETMGEMTSKTIGEKEGMAQPLAIAALALGVLGLGLCFSNSRPAFSGAVVAGLLAAGSLIGLMFEVKKWFNNMLAKDAADKVAKGADDIGLGNMGNVKPTLAFTSWFYIAIVAFLAAAFFCYKRMSVKK